MGNKKLGITLILIVLFSLSVSNNDTLVSAQTQKDWSPEIGERFNCMNTVAWSHDYGTLNGWSLLCAETLPEVGILETWSDIPNPNTTFYNEEFDFIGSSVFEAVFSSHIFQGQDQHWFNYILPNRNASVFESLLETLTVGPWNHTINPQYFEDEDTPSPTYWGYDYSFSHEEYSYNVSVTYWITAGYGPEEHYSGVIREGWIKIYNISLGEEVQMRRIRCSPGGPAITSQRFYHSGELIGQDDIGEYTEGEINNILSWGPIFLPNGVTASYSIRMNGTVVFPEQTHLMSPHWTMLDASSVNFSVDGLDAGVYNFTILVRDYTHNMCTSTFILTVKPYLYTNEIITGFSIVALIGIGVYYFRRRQT